MSIIATVLFLSGQAWAVNSEGERRALKVGDELRQDETLVTAEGTRIDLDFGSDQQLTLLGEQQIAVNAVPEQGLQGTSEPLTAALSEQISEETEPARTPTERGYDGHNFVQLVRIAEIIEADGITPLTVARIQEILRPLGMSLPERDNEMDRDWEFRGVDERNVMRRDFESDQDTPLLPVNNLVTLDVPQDLQAVVADGNDTDQVVFESGLADGSNPNVADTRVISQFTFEALDGLDPQEAVTFTFLDINGEPDTLILTKAQVEALGESPISFTTQYGQLTLNGFNQAPNGSITLDYAYLLERATQIEGGATDSIVITVNDSDVDSASDALNIRIVEDALLAVDDTNQIFEDAVLVEGNVIGGPGASEGDSPDSLGPTGADVTGVVAGNADIADGNVAIGVEGEFGSLILNADGSYSYTLDNDNLNVQGLIEGEALTETFTYTLTDGNGVQSTASLTITINGMNDLVAVTVPTELDAVIPDGNNTDQVVFESGLANGSDPNAADTQVISSFSFEALDGLDPLEAVTLSFVEINGTPGTLTMTQAQVESLAGSPISLTTQYGELTLNGYSQGADGTITLDYEYILERAPQVFGESTDDIIGITVKDRDGDSDSTNLTIRIVDDAPLAEDDVNSIPAGSFAVIEGNVIGGGSASQDDVADVVGADGATITQLTFNGNNFAVVAGQTTTIEGDYGTLLIDSDGSYSYERFADSAGGVEDVFTYTLTDADGDFDTATLTIEIADSSPTLNGLTPEAEGGDLTLFEANLSNGTDSDSDALTQNGTFTLSSPDGIATLIVGGETVIADNIFTPVTVDSANGTLIITSYDSATGEVSYSYTLNTKTDHDAQGNDSVFETFAIALTDTDGDDASGTLTIQIVDDQPTITVTDNLAAIEVDETVLAAMGEVSNSAIFADAFSVIYGADEMALNDALIYSLDVDNNIASGLQDTSSGEVIVLVNNAGVIEGRTASTNELALTVTVDSETAQVTLTQLRAVSHPDGDDPDDVIQLNDGALTLTAQATDGDGDVVSETISIGGQLSFRDDGPSVGTPESVSVDEQFLATGSAAGEAPTSVTGNLDVDFGADGGGVADTIFDQSTLDALIALNVTTNSVPLIYSLSPEGYTITAQGGVDGPAIFTVTITNPNGSNDTQPGYSFELTGAVDHGGLDQIELRFPFSVSDGDGDNADGSFIVNIIDDKPIFEDRTFTFDEDNPVIFNVSSDANPNNTIINKPDGLADSDWSVVTNGDGSISYAYSPDFDGPQDFYGTITVDEDGRITYQPDENYSNLLSDGTFNSDSFSYTLTQDDLSETTVAVTLNINAVADAPELEADKTVATLEDESVPLGLVLPIITDTVDQNAAADGDNPERLGAINLSLEDAPAGTVLTQDDGTELIAGDDGSYTIVIVTESGTMDVDTSLHIADSALPENNVNYLTQAEYEALSVKPAADRHENFDVRVRVESFEVDSDRVPLPDVDSAESEQVIEVLVQAVTDEVDLAFDTTQTTPEGVIGSIDYSGDATAKVFIEEDTTFNLSNLLNASFEDLDGSEQRSITIDNPEGNATIIVNGTEVPGGGSITIAAPGLSTSTTSFPEILLGGGPDVSGDLEGIIITLNALDQDPDGFADGFPGPQPESDSVTLDLFVNPIAGDVIAGEAVTTPEDTTVAFLANVAVTDSAADGGTERITQVEFSLPDGWVLIDQPAADASWSISGDGSEGNPYIIVAENADTDLQSILDGFTILPPAHSSLDANIAVKVTTEDRNTVDGDLVISDPIETDLVIEVEVTPVAERVGEDSDGNNNDDLTINPDYEYQTTGSEDQWFTLGVEDGFDLGADWNNEDANEQTFALLTPVLISGDGGSANAEGSQFRYSTNGVTTDEGGDWVTLVYNGSGPVEVPAAFLETLQFKAVEDFSGKFEVAVQAKTVDFDDDAPLDPAFANEQISGNATLSNILILPVADQVTLAVNGLARGDEDTAIPLNFRPTSSDPSETFDVRINNIPEGAVLLYDGVSVEIENGVAIIENFSSNLPLTIQPPDDDNTNFALTVEARSIDTVEIDGQVYTDISDWSEEKTVQIQVTGVADGAELTSDNELVLEEATVDNDSGVVPLSSLITNVALNDNDGSETLSIKISLPEGFSLEGGAPLGGNTWILGSNQLAAANIIVPEHFSGTVNVDVELITTEDDGDSVAQQQSLSFQITPSPEGVMTTSSALTEDTLGQVSFTLQSPDPDEVLSAVFILSTDVEDNDTISFYYGNSTNTPLAEGLPGVEIVEIGGINYYSLTGEAINNIYAMGAPNLSGDEDFTVRYEVTDPSTDGTLPAVTLISDDVDYRLEIAPVTDAATLEIVSITATDNPENASIESNQVNASGNTELTLLMRLTKDEDPNAGGERDYDGSERITSIVIDGVPQGVTIAGAQYIGNVPDVGSNVNTGRWVLQVNESLTGPYEFDLVFELGGTAATLADLNNTLTISAITQDVDAAPITASADWLLITPPAGEFDDGEAQNAVAAVIDLWEDDVDFIATEDQVFSLNDAINAEIEGNSAFAITLTDLPEGTLIQGMQRTVVDGEEVWTASGNGDDAALQALMDSIQITLPENFNSNNLAGDLQFQATLTTSAPGDQRNVEVIDVNQPITPVSDPAQIDITSNNVNEGEAVNFDLTITNPADSPSSQIVDGRVYLQLNQSADLAGEGQLFLGEDELSLQAISGVPGIADGQYYVIDDVAMGDNLQLTYQSGLFAAGTVSLEAFVVSQETGASNIASGSGNASVDVLPVNSGFGFTDEDDQTIDIIMAAGDEDTRIQIPVNGGLNDADGSEQVIAVLLRDLPEGFLVFAGEDADSASLANNAGGNTWSISTQAGQLPAYIAIQPPLNWSGTLTDISLVALTSEAALSDVEETSVTIQLTAEPVADGIEISPTLTFGNEINIIPINLNAAMPDQDGSETATISVTGLGEFAAFYAGNTLLEGRFEYDQGTDTYTINGLTPEEVDNLGFVQSAGNRTIEVTAFTIDESDGVTDTSDVVTGSFQSNTSAQLATNAANTWIYSDEIIRNGLGGEDTIQLRFGESVSGSQLDTNLDNIEVIDLSIAGENRINALTAEDVFGMTDNNNLLKIMGDNADTVDLESDWVFDSSDGSTSTYTALFEGATVTVQIANEINVE